MLWVFLVNIQQLIAGTLPGKTALLIAFASPVQSNPLHHV